MEPNTLDERFNGTPVLTEEKKKELTRQNDVLSQENEVLQEEISATPAGQTSQQQTTAPKGDVKIETPIEEGKIKGIFNPYVNDLLAWNNRKERPREKLEELLAIPSGVIDFGVDFLNKVSPGGRPQTFAPFKLTDDEGNLNKIPKFQSEGAQAIREISSVVIPTIWLTAKTRGMGNAAHSKIGWSLGNDAFFRWLASSGLAAWSGMTVDDIAEVQGTDDNLMAVLKESWPNTWGFIPEDWATQDGDSEDVIRQKNKNEGVGLGLFSDIFLGAAKLAKALRKVQHATGWIPENELAIKRLEKLKGGKPLSENEIENVILQSAKSRDDSLTELGAVNITKSVDLDKPMLGVHDLYGYTESGIRSVDGLDINTAALNVYRIEKNIDTVYGRVGSVMSEGAIKFGLEADDAGTKLINDISKNLEARYGYKTSNGRYLSHSEIMDAGDRLAADLYKMDVTEMKKLLSGEAFTGKDPSSGVRVLTDKGYAGVFKAIKSYLDDYVNMNLAKAQAYIGTSFAGQVSDMAEGARLMTKTPAEIRAQEQILDRLQYLMQIKGTTSYTRGRALNQLNLWNRLKTGLSSKQAVEAAIKNEKNETLKALARIQQEAQSTMDTLRAVQKERPQMLGPLMLAYEVTDGNVNSISKLNEYVKNTTGVVRKSLFDARSDMPSAWTQGVWANIYNSVLSAVGTPLKAGLSNTVLMVERPLSTYAGALLTGDWHTLRRANYMYTVGMVDTMQKAFGHMNQVFRRASTDPSSVGYIMRDDIARKNEGVIQVNKAFADAKAQEGLYGPSVMVEQIEALNDLAEHPVLRFSANAMTAFDGFTRSWVGNVEARGRAFDQILNSGQKLDNAKLKKVADGVYNEMFDSNGFITDKAVEYASKEIAMNLDNPMVDALSSMIQRVPALKPFLMFPKTSINMMSFTASHSPIGLFFDQVNAFKRPFAEMNTDTVERLLKNRGLPFDENAEAVYNTIRAELKGRKAIGTLTVLGAAGLFTTDRLRGNGIYDKTRQQVRREQGWKPRTYKGWDGKWYSYENLGAISDWLAFTADVMDNFDTLDEPSIELFLNKAGYLISANLTNKSFTAGLEPLNDVLAGNPAAMARWTASFGSSLAPLSGFRNEFARLLTPQLKEVEQDFFQLLANRNPSAKDTLPNVHDYIDGGLIGEPMNFFTRVWNTYSPLWKVSESLSPEKQFLIDIEFDARPSLMKNGRGIDYTPTERSAVTNLMGKDGFFKKEIKRIMNTTTGKEFRKAYKLFQSKGIPVDRELFKNIHIELESALRDAQKFAEGRIPQINEVKKKTWINQEIDRQLKYGDEQALDEILRLQKLE